MKIDKNAAGGPSRRNFLRGAGVALALPWFESLAFGATGTSGVSALGSQPDPNKPPIRFGLVYFSNGVEPEHWWAKDNNGKMDLGPGPKPLQPYVDDLIFTRGLYNQKAVENPSPHLGRMPNFLSGSEVSLDPAVIRCGKTFDQVMADAIGHHTAVPSLALGIEPNELRLEDGVSMIYGSCISWATPSRPATKEIYPARVFDQMVGDGKGRRLDRSVLDAVLSDAHSLQGKVSVNDRHKLDEYLESIRDIETRIERAAKQERIEGWRPTLDKPDMPRPKDELPQEIPDHIQLMLDLMVLGFQMDKTRIATLMLNNDLSQMNFRFLDGVQGALHLDLTHNGKEPEKEAMYLKTNQYHIGRLGYVIERMKNIQEGEGTLLDNTILMGASNLFDGDAHQADHMPIILAGRGGGTLKPGRILDYMDSGDDKRRACSLYLSIMDRMGVQLDRFGDTSKRLTDL